MPHIVVRQTPHSQHATHKPGQHDEPLCFFSVVRYVADTIRDEPRNIGVLVVCPNRKFGGVQFSAAHSGIAMSTPQYAQLESLLRSYDVALPRSQQHLPSFAPVPPHWTRAELETLHRECSNAIQFTSPAAALGEPTALLAQLFQERVAAPKDDAKESQSRASFSAKVAARVVRRRLGTLTKRYRVEESIPVPIGGRQYAFGVAISNGHLQCAIEALSFQVNQVARLRHAEEKGAWYSRVWPDVAQATGAHGYLLVEPPQSAEEQLDTATAQMALDEYQRVTGWAHEANIEVRRSDEVETVADEIAARLEGPHLV